MPLAQIVPIPFEVKHTVELVAPKGAPQSFVWTTLVPVYSTLFAVVVGAWITAHFNAWLKNRDAQLAQIDSRIEILAEMAARSSAYTILVRNHLVSVENFELAKSLENHQAMLHYDEGVNANVRNAQEEFRELVKAAHRFGYWRVPNSPQVVRLGALVETWREAQVAVSKGSADPDGRLDENGRLLRRYLDSLIDVLSQEKLKLLWRKDEADNVSVGDEPKFLVAAV